MALPNVWLFQLLLPALSPLADLMFVFSLLSVWATRTSHGATYALVNLEQVLTYYAVFLLVDWAAAIVAFLMEPREDKQLTWLREIVRPKDDNRGVILVTHHQYYTAFPDHNYPKPAQQLDTS